MKHFQRVFLSILLLSMFVSTGFSQTRLEATYNSTSLYSQVASLTYNLTLKHPMNGAVGLGNFLTDTIQLGSGTLMNPSITFKDSSVGLFASSIHDLAVATASGTRLRISGGSGIYYESMTEFSSWGSTGGLPRILLNAPATNATPTYSFNRNTNTGLGRNAVGEPSMVASGVEAMRWTNNQTLIGATGSVSLPGLAFKDDPDTGFFSAGANTINVVTGGVNYAQFNYGGYGRNNFVSTTFGVSTNSAFITNTPTLIRPQYSFASSLNSGLACYFDFQPSMVASGTEAMRFTNATTTVFTYFVASTPHYEDLRFPGVGLNLVGAPTAATLNTTNYYGALNFPDATISDSGSIAQMPHGWRNGSSIEPHLHLVNNSATPGTATFELWYKIASPTGNFPAAYTVATLSALLEGSTVKHQMFDFPSISMTGYGDSTCISFMLRRVGTHASDTLADTAILLEFDLHYIHESFGSVNEHGD